MEKKKEKLTVIILLTSPVFSIVNRTLFILFRYWTGNLSYSYEAGFANEVLKVVH